MFFKKKPDYADVEKAERLYEKYRTRLYWEAYEILRDKHSAEDAVGETFVRVMKNLHKIDESDEKRTRAYLKIICRNIAVDIYNGRNRESTVNHTETETDVLTDTYNPEKIVISQETVNGVKTYMEKMDPKYKEVILLSRSYRMSLTEVADSLGTTVETVKKRLYRGRNMIRHDVVAKDYITKE